jgi:hypothetical protein
MDDLADPVLQPDVLRDGGHLMGGRATELGAVCLWYGRGARETVRPSSADPAVARISSTLASGGAR